MRHGQWMKFKISLANKPFEDKLRVMAAHVTPDGYFLGIHLRAGREADTSVTTPDGQTVRSGGKPVPARIMIVDSDGANIPLMMRGPDGTASVVNAVIFPHECEDLQPCTEADHLPARRRQHLEPGTKLPA